MATQKQPGSSRAAPATKSPATKDPSAKSPSTKAPARKAAPARKSPSTKAPARRAAPAKKDPSTTAPASKAAKDVPAGRPARTRAASAPVTRAAPESSRPHRSAVAALLAEHPGDQPGPSPRPAADVAAEVARAGEAVVSDALHRAERRAGAVVAGGPEAAARHAAAGPDAPGIRLSPETGLPPIQDVALGAASLLAERMWSAGAVGLAWANGVAARTIAFVRAVSPLVATEQADARLQALAERGQRVRRERTEALSEAVTTAITTAATSDAVREMTVAAIEQATDDVLDVVLPALLDAVTEMETQDKLDELMAGLLLRQLPSALEKTLPGVMLRTATKPALGFVPSLMGALAAGLTGEAGAPRD